MQEHSKLPQPVATIMKAIANGHLSRKEAIATLEKMVNDELMQQEHPANMQQVSACERLLQRLNTGKHTHLPDTRWRDWHSLCSHVYRKTRRAKERRLTWKGMLSPTSVSIALLLVVLIIPNLSFELGRAVEVTTDKHDAYRLQGKSMRFGITSSASAYEDEADVVHFTELEEIRAYLGEEPNFPQVLSDGKTVEYWQMFVAPKQYRVLAIYTQEPDEKAVTHIDVAHYYEYDDVDFSIFQSEEGVHVDYRGRDIYIGQSVNYSFACWVEGKDVYSIISSISTEEMKEYVKQFLEP